MTWQQDIIKAEEREKQLRKALDKPFGVRVTSVSTESEIGKFSWYANRDRPLSINHPYSGPNSWIRAMPEEGTSYIATFRADEGAPNLINTYKRSAKNRINSYRKGIGVYRPIYPGELDINSVGLGQVYLPRRPIVEARGGVTERWANQDQMQVGDRAPTHVRQFLQHSSGELGDELRIGVVSRPSNTWQLSYPKVRDNFAAEYFLSLKNPANENPDELFRLQRGHVLNADGEQIKQTATQVPLRLRDEFFANDESSTRYEIDERGNVFIILADAATDGYEVRIPAGNYIKQVDLDERVSVGGNEIRTIQGNVRRSVEGNLSFTVKKDLILTSKNGGANFIMDSTPDREQVALSTKSGHLLFFNDTPGDEQIFIQHKTGSQINIDSDGSIKAATNGKANTFHMNAVDGSVTARSRFGSYATFKDGVTLSDQTGKQVINFNGKDKLQIFAASDVIINAPKSTVSSGSIDLGPNASFSAVLAEQLAILFDTHTHGTIFGNTTPPLPPQTAALVNANPATAFKHSFIKLKGNV